MTGQRRSQVLFSLAIIPSSPTPGATLLTELVGEVAVTSVFSFLLNILDAIIRIVRIE
jgi:hypothetical protein